MIFGLVCVVCEFLIGLIEGVDYIRVIFDML